MSLATRCTACGTVFRIVEDQLRVSDGWVRCGRCAEVFDAREMLFDIERDAPPPWPANFAPSALNTPPAPTLPPTSPPPPPTAPAPTPAPAWEPPPEPDTEPGLRDALPTGWPEDASRQEPRWVDEEQRPSTAPAAARAPTEPLRSRQPDVVAAGSLPEFMRRAESDARWNRPAVRAALGLLSLLLAALLALQLALHFRDAIAALHPPARGILQSLCGTLGCELRPWRRIEALSIESTSLNPVGKSGYRLHLSLRNKTAVDVAAPWVELSLTDSTGAALARRVLEPRALSPSLTQVNADSEQALSFSFSTGEQRVSGYSVNIFYP
ncbi:MAG: zinc-ribbon domain-containing protein [Proteobacteria bacterium]|jgi:predicted Zn finger-like uncharacterized protein|nr:hypothetical protein [Methylibium sp.]MCH8855666.1 zinc-ribbon domain-containing protein [Pseudomonadota bacterium]|mmetsp:Transcript_5900/g.14499  ORF Transcript_5900/g.14499 Transcript_5900/m.14499 type:complete len:325 (+) Transcript_5900:2948-3922(+)